MKRTIITATMLPLLLSCGTIGIGANDTVNVFNQSKDTISVIGARGVSRIVSNSSTTVSGKDYMQINSSNPNCNSTSIPRETNSAAVVLDIIPGLVFGIIPIIVDAVTSNLSRMPESYTYNCN